MSHIYAQNHRHTADTVERPRLDGWAFWSEALNNTAAKARLLRHIFQTRGAIVDDIVVSDEHDGKVLRFIATFAIPGEYVEYAVWVDSAMAWWQTYDDAGDSTGIDDHVGLLQSFIDRVMPTLPDLRPTEQTIDIVAFVRTRGYAALSDRLRHFIDLDDRGDGLMHAAAHYGYGTVHHDLRPHLYAMRRPAGAPEVAH